MTNCCEKKKCEITAMRESHSKVLWIVLAINAVMFVVEGSADLLTHSTSLLADALDMLGDALVYGFSGENNLKLYNFDRTALVQRYSVIES